MVSFFGVVDHRGGVVSLDHKTAVDHDALDDGGVVLRKVKSAQDECFKLGKVTVSAALARCACLEVTNASS